MTRLARDRAEADETEFGANTYTNNTVTWLLSYLQGLEEKTRQGNMYN